jgi:hypothetical protein
MARPRVSELNDESREFLKLMAKAKCESYEDVAEMIGVTVRTARGYGENRPVPEPVKRLLRAIPKYGISVKSIASKESHVAEVRKAKRLSRDL